MGRGLNLWHTSGVEDPAARCQVGKWAVPTRYVKRSLRRRTRKSSPHYRPNTRRPPTTSCCRRRSGDTDPAPLTASETDVEAAINSMRPGSVAGLDGVRALHLQQLISKEAAESGRRLIRSLTRLTNLLLQGAAPECARAALFGASLCAMRKGDGGLRPIAMGSIYRRLACRIAARHVATTVGEELRPVQLGVGTPQGCEAAVHATREYLAVAAAAGSPHLLVKVDVRNAFNTVRRDAFLTQVKARVPAVYPLLRNTYSEPTQLCIATRPSPPAAACSRATHSARRRLRWPSTPSSEP